MASSHTSECECEVCAPIRHAEMFAASPIKVGQRYRFDYPVEFESLPEYSAKRGSPVTVVRPCTAAEADVLWDTVEGVEQIIDRMFVVQTDDGWTGHAWESELAAMESAQA